ncbi:MAG: DUF4189 domain-containing protein [Bradyrhizobium sp.]|nr:DUF4189 domain-containing protein [Bradyrhizobium sp.]
MQAARSIPPPARVAIALLIAGSLLPGMSVANDAARGLIVAQGGGFEKLPPLVAPTPYSPNAPSQNSPSYPAGPEHSPDTNSNPSYPDRSNPSSDILWGAIAFTADGSYSTTWKMASQPEAEAKVLRQCARFGRGGCEVVSFSGQECAALATFIGPYRRRRWSLSFTGGGMTYPAAQGAAMDRCNSDERAQGRCQPRTAACADGR